MQNVIESEYGQFMQSISSLLPVRLEYYKAKQMERRIRDLARKHQAPDLLSFAAMMRGNRAILQEFEQHITINVSEFYRNPEPFNYLLKNIFPALIARPQGVKVWSAGCSNGSEPYTLAMLLMEHMPRRHHSIYATDIDRVMLDKARTGAGYIAEDVRGLPRPLRDKYMVADGATFKVADEVKKLVRFERHDLLADKMNQKFDLIACRNVVIYFTDDAKATLYAKFVDALEPGGVFFIGATETISRPNDLDLRYVAPCFYVKGKR